jgi:TonB family protein
MGIMKTLCLIVIFAAIATNTIVQTSTPVFSGHEANPDQSLSDNEIGKVQYPQTSDLAEATQRLLEARASTWLAARVFHTEDSIEKVAKYFKEQAQKANKPGDANALLKSLTDDNWKVSKVNVSLASNVFGVGKELRVSRPAEKVETGFGVIVLDDSIVQVHLMSPHPSSSDNTKLTSGTMIVMIKERLTEQSSIENEKIYTGREVTRRARLKSKPEPEYPASGMGGGTVVLRAVLSASGKVTNIRTVSGPSREFTEAAVRAARKITFEPAIKDGRYVSQWIQLEYNFIP